MSRSLEVADLERSIRFYRERIGFSVTRGAAGSAEAVSGPARLVLTESDAGGSHPVVFFETNDVAAMHAALTRMGAGPSPLEDVNWIKVRAFEVRDPDGHVLWFGGAVGGPDVPSEAGMLHRIMPALPLTDVSAGVAHYRDVLGFGVNYAQKDIAVMDRDRTRLLLVARTDRHAGIGGCYFYVRDADALHAELTSKGARVQGAPVSQPWGLREFLVLDPEGNELTFGQPFE